jgi:hypothetical protein
MPCAEGDIKSGKLLMRRDGADTGARPIDPCTNFWSSPDLFVSGGTSNTQAQQGVVHTIRARVKNISTQAVEDVNVEAWVCDYTAGPLPTGQISPPGKVSGFRPGTLGAGASAVIDCSPTWTPTAAQVAMNNGHLCLAANTWAELPRPDGVELPAAGTLKICCDSHHAQCNISLVGTGESGEAEIDMMLRAPEELDAMRMRLELRAITGREGFGAGEKRLLRSHRKFGRRKITLSRHKPREFFFEGPGIEPTREAELEVDSKKGIRLRIHAAKAKGQPKNTLQLFDITTTDPETGELIGGARLMVLAQ